MNFLEIRLPIGSENLFTGINLFLAFSHYNSRKSICNEICRVPFLANSLEECIFYKSSVPEYDYTIVARSVDSAFWASQFSDDKIRQKIAKMTPLESLKFAQNHPNKCNFSYEHRFNLMCKLLDIKFRSNISNFTNLLKTGSAFLINYNDTQNQNMELDNSYGFELTLVSLALMRVRYLLAIEFQNFIKEKELISKGAFRAVLSTQEFLNQFIKIETGEVRENYEKKWRPIVRIVLDSYHAHEQEFLKKSFIKTI
jgi:hypothetical protein